MILFSFPQFCQRYSEVMTKEKQEKVMKILLFSPLLSLGIKSQMLYYIIRGRTVNNVLSFINDFHKEFEM